MKRTLFFSVFVLLFSYLVYSQPVVQYNSLSDPVPIDPKIKYGTLPNGLKYYIRFNQKPEKRAELMLVVNAGAICEDPDQNGLAHFCEHMAFNGTKNFPRQALVDFLESIGVKFGPELNAFTSWDETVYMLQVPTDSLNQFNNGFQILEDWAHNVSYDPTEIDKERGVVIEEYRLGRGADERVERKHNKFLFYNSKYAIHDVIGDTNILRNASYDVIKRFYKDWYRPDLMAVIAVGDFDVDYVEKLVKEKFAAIPKPENPRRREYVKIPPHPEVFVSIASDKELLFPRVEITFKGDKIPEGTFGDYREFIKRQLFTNMLNYRLREYLRKENPPFKFFASSYVGNLGRENSSFVLFAGAIGNEVNRCVETLLLEAFRAYQHGFSQTEFERAKNEMLRMYESSFKERDKTESINYAFEYVRHFLKGEPIPGIEYEYELVKKWLPEIKLEEVNSLPKKFIKKENAVIAVSLPERPDVVAPKENEIKTLFETYSTKPLEPYVDIVPTKPLFDKKVSEGKIVSEKQLKEFDAIEYVLENGAKVVAKKTNFKDDEVYFRAFSPGGSSLVADSDYFNLSFAPKFIEESGIGSFNKTELDKYLSDKIVSLSPRISSYEEFLTGNSSPKDLRTFFELLNLYFNQPRADKEAFNAVKKQWISYVEDAQNNPERLFRDSVSFYTWNKHFRRKPWSKDLIESVNFFRAYDLFTQRFQSPSDFVFIFVGNFDYDTLKNFIRKYIASIPGNGIKEKPKDDGVRYFNGKIDKVFKKGMENKSYVRLILSNPFVWDLKERFMLKALEQLLGIRLREVLREDKGGTYGVGAWFQTRKFPQPDYSLNITFGCDPTRVEELTNDAIGVLKEVTTKKEDQIYLTKIKEIFKRDLEVNLKENWFWTDLIYNYYNDNYPLNYIDVYRKMIENLTLDDLLTYAKKYIKFDNFAKFVLYPESN